MLWSKLVIDVASVALIAAPWDALAVSLKKPYAAPAWLLAWWRHVAPKNAELRIVAVYDDAKLIGLAPFYLDGKTLRPLGAGICVEIEPLSVEGRESEVAERTVAEFSAARPRPQAMTLEGVKEFSPWPALLMRGWPGGRTAMRAAGKTFPAPLLNLAKKTAENWHHGRGGNSRELARCRRRLKELGAVVELVSEGDFTTALRSFAELHAARWSAKGGSGVLQNGVEEMLADAAKAMTSDGRMRLYALKVDGKTIASAIFVAAGGEISYWLGGHDDAWNNRSPSKVLVAEAIEDGIKRGDCVLDLGPGGQSYKYEFADGENTLNWMTIIPPGRAQVIALGRRFASGCRRRVQHAISSLLAS